MRFASTCVAPPARAAVSSSLAARLSVQTIVLETIMPVNQDLHAFSKERQPTGIFEVVDEIKLRFDIGIVVCILVQDDAQGI